MGQTGDIYDMAIIGGGPVGLFAAFYAGMRGLRTMIIDSLEELGGQLIAVYPEKYIYDIAGYQKILAKDYVAEAVRQGLSTGAEAFTNEQVQMLERVEDDNLIRVATNKAERWTKTALICAGVGAFEPKRLEAPGASDLEGRGVHYFVRNLDQFRDKDVVIVGGGDSAVDWALTLHPIARQVTLIHRSKFRAHEKSIEEVHFHHTRSGESHVAPAQALIVAIGFAGHLGPLKEWGFTIERNTIVVDPLTMETSIPGVFGAGDIVTHPAKFKLIATGAAEAVIAVNHAVTFIDPKARLDPGHSTNIMEKMEKKERAATV